MSKKIACVLLPASMGGVVTDMEGDYLLDRIKKWAESARSGHVLTLTAIKFTREELDNMEEYCEGD